MKTDESKRRKLNVNFDNEPSYGHQLNLDISRKYIKGKKVLDIGCWSGQFEKLSSKIAKQIIGLDPGASAINFAKKNIKGAKFIVGKAQKLPFSKNSFDTIMFMDVIEHLPKKDEDKALREIYRVLKTNGTLVLSTPNKHLISIILDPAYFLINHRHYSVEELSELLTSNNFKIIKIYQKGNLIKLLYELTQTVFKNLFNIKLKVDNNILKAVAEDNKKDGFAENYVIAKRIR